MPGNPLLGLLEGVGTENLETFFGPRFEPKKVSRFSVPTPSNRPSNGFASIKLKKIIIIGEHWSFQRPTFANNNFFSFSENSDILKLV